MVNNLLDFIAKGDGNYYFEDFGEALIYAITGFLIVFVGISLIILIIWLLGLVLRKTNNLAFLRNLKTNFKGKKNQKKIETTDSLSADNEVEDIPDEVKAAIVAAVMAFCNESAPEREFVVKRIKRI